MYEVPLNVQAKILMSLFTAQAKSIVNQMSIDDMSKYDEPQEFLLTEYKLTPKKYKIRFETAVKCADETYTMFAARLCNLLSYYLKSRLVEDYETLIELLISDRLKGLLPQKSLNYILTQEGESWYVASKVASLVDVYVNNRATVIDQKAPEGKSAKVATAVTSDGGTAGQNYRGGRSGRYQPRRGKFSRPQSPTQTQKVRCYSCGELGHMARDCPPEQNVFRSRTTVMVDTEAVPENDTVEDTEEVTEAALKAEAFVSTSCQRWVSRERRPARRVFSTRTAAGKSLLLMPKLHHLGSI